MSAESTSTSATTVHLNDIDVSYRKSGDGPAVVFIHGLAEDHTSWKRQQHELNGYRTYSYDLRGHGASSPGEANGSVSQLRDDLILFLAEVSGPAVCVGFSLGGVIVLAAAAERPDLVTGVIVAGTSTVVGGKAASFYTERISRVHAGDEQGVAEAMREDTAAAVTDSSVDIDALTAWRLAAIGDGAGYANAAAAMSSLRENPLTPALASVHCPTAVVGGEWDTFCPRKAAEIILAALPAATYQEIPAAGHLMTIDNPTAVTSAVRTALERMI